MKQRIANILAGSLLAFTLFGAAMAGPLEDGAAAYERGDYAAAMSHWRPLAERGNARAQNFVGLMYQKGLGVPQDDAQAAAWYRKAAEQGNSIAQGMLGGMYLKGHGVPQDDAQAAAWLRKAAAQGLVLAQLDLGVMYEHGQGVPQDYVTAQMWFNLSASRATGAEDRRSAAKNRDELAAKMTPAQIAEAQRMARGWKPSNRAGDAPGSGRVRSVVATLEPPVDARGESAVPMVSEGGTFKVPVTINGQLTLKFVVDSGAADVSIPADVVLTLLRTETITDADFLGKQTYQLADGSTVPSQRFVIRTLKIGGKTLENVVGSIAPVEGSPLLGQSFLSRFKSWSIDNQRRALILN